MKRLNLRLLAPLKSYRVGMINLSSAVVLYYLGQDAAKMMIETIGHDMTEVLTTKLVRFSYAIIGMIILAASCKPFYRFLEHLTGFNTDEELGLNNIAVGIKTGLCFLGFLIAAAMIISAAIRP